MSGRFGYSCQCSLSLLVQRQLGKSAHRYHVWFSRELSPVQNGDSSNPLELYRMVDRAVKAGDTNHPKLLDLKANLIRVVRLRVQPRDPSLGRRLIQQIELAGMQDYRPQLWRLDLDKIAPERVRIDQSKANWDEQYVDTLYAKEYEVIVE